MRLFVLDATAYDQFVEVLVEMREDDGKTPLRDHTGDEIPDRRFQIAFGDDAAQLADIQAQVTAHVTEQQTPPPQNTITAGLTITIPDVAIAKVLTLKR